MSKGFQKPQCIGCQHHLLDLLLKHVMNFLIQEPTSKPELNYSFIDKFTGNYVALQVDYHLVATDDVNTGTHDGEMILSSYMNYVRYIVITKQTSHWPGISWKKLPNLHQARWNSRAIYTVIAFSSTKSGAAILLQYVTSSAMNGQMLGSIRNTTMKHPSMNCLAHSPR